jgi:hypothetical protein
MGDLSIRWEVSIKVDIKENWFQGGGRLNWLRMTNRLLINHTESYKSLLPLLVLMELAGWSTLLPYLDEEKLEQLSNLRTLRFPKLLWKPGK